MRPRPGGSRGTGRRRRARVRRARRCARSSRTERRCSRCPRAGSRAIASITSSGHWVPPGPSKNASGRSRADVRFRTASTSKATALIGRAYRLDVVRPASYGEGRAAPTNAERGRVLRPLLRVAGPRHRRGEDDRARTPCGISQSSRASSSGHCSKIDSTPENPKQPDSRSPGRPRARADRRLLRDQPGSRLRRGACSLRQSAQRLLAAAACGRLHASAARAGGAARAPRAGLRRSRTRRRRTTPGSGDLRRADFADSAERLERIAVELRPRAIGFVGKEAYRGTFAERPELGGQSRRLGETGLFVLPSTSPANAAVPWEERLRWFRAFRTSL